MNSSKLIDVYLHKDYGYDKHISSSFRVLQTHIYIALHLKTSPLNICLALISFYFPDTLMHIWLQIEFNFTASLH